MIPFDSILQVVDKRIYSLHKLWSSYHIHKSTQDSVEFYGVSCDEGKLFVLFKNGDKFIYSGVQDDLLKYLDAGEDIYPLLTDLNNGKYSKEPTDATLTEVPLKEVALQFCRMQDHIVMTNGMWATDRPDLFKNQPHFDLMFQLKFEDPE